MTDAAATTHSSATPWLPRCHNGSSYHTHRQQQVHTTVTTHKPLARVNASDVTHTSDDAESNQSSNWDIVIAARRQLCAMHTDVTATETQTNTTAHMRVDALTSAA
jgi:hypothetical protein